VTAMKEFKDKSEQELTTQLIELRKKQFGLRMQQGSGQPVKPSEIKSTRKDIARIKTMLNMLKSEVTN